MATTPKRKPAANTKAKPESKNLDVTLYLCVEPSGHYYALTDDDGQGEIAYAREEGSAVHKISLLVPKTTKTVEPVYDSEAFVDLT